MPKIKTFPKTITVKIEEDSAGDYLVANPGTDLRDHADMFSSTKVGVYQLSEVLEVTGAAQSRVISKGKGK